MNLTFYKPWVTTICFQLIVFALRFLCTWSFFHPTKVIQAVGTFDSLLGFFLKTPC